MGAKEVFHVPVPADGLVLETGSGARPYFRSNVLCDAFLTGQQRAGLELVNDRPLVLGFAEKLPFKDDSFDFVIKARTSWSRRQIRLLFLKKCNE